MNRKERRGPEAGARRGAGKAPVKVLVADADPRFRGDACGYLSAQGCHVRGIATPAVLIAELESWRPDTLFLSLALPGLDLGEVARAMQRSSAGSRVIYLQDPERPVRAYGLGRIPCLARLEKPLPLTELRFFV